jgi:hypothetical protein
VQHRPPPSRNRQNSRHHGLTFNPTPENRPLFRSLRFYTRADTLSTAQLLARASRAGTHIGAFCRAIHAKQGELGVRRILGALSLVKKFGTAAVEEGCATALELQVHECRLVRRNLERRPQASLSLQQADPLIRELCTIATSSSSGSTNKRSRVCYSQRATKSCRKLPRNCGSEGNDRKLKKHHRAPRSAWPRESSAGRLTTEERGDTMNLVELTVPEVSHWFDQ